MPCTYQIFSDDNLILKTFLGRVTARCVLDLVDQLEADTAFREGMSELEDFRAVTDLAITVEEIAQFIELAKVMSLRRQARARKVVLFASEPVRMAGNVMASEMGYANGTEFGMFREPDEALFFLGLEHSDVSRALSQANGLTIH